MSRGLGKVERKILEYMNMLTNDCKGAIEDCEAVRYGGCPYSDVDEERTASTNELCKFIAGIWKCPVDIEDFRNKETYTDSVYKSVLRATKSLENKGYIIRAKNKNSISMCERGGRNWWIEYKYVKRILHGKYTK